MISYNPHTFLSLVIRNPELAIKTFAISIISDNCSTFFIEQYSSSQTSFDVKKNSEAGKE